MCDILSCFRYNLFTNNKSIYSENDSIICKICFENKIDILFKPCKHAMICKNCYDRVKKCKNLCPYCCNDIVLIETFYIVD